MVGRCIGGILNILVDRDPLLLVHRLFRRWKFDFFFWVSIRKLPWGFFQNFWVRNLKFGTEGLFWNHRFRDPIFCTYRLLRNWKLCLFMSSYPNAPMEILQAFLSFGTSYLVYNNFLGVVIIGFFYLKFLSESFYGNVFRTFKYFVQILFTGYFLYALLFEIPDFWEFGTSHLWQRPLIVLGANNLASLWDLVRNISCHITRTESTEDR